MTSTIFTTTGMQNLAWFFYWGNFTLLAIEVGLIVWIFLHSFYKETKANIFKILSIFSLLLLIPSIVFSFSSIEVKTKLSNFILLFFILGLVSLVLIIIISIVYFFNSKNEKKNNYCEIHKIYYDGGICPLCALDFEFSSNKKYDDSTKFERDINAKGFLINTANSRVYNLYSSNFIGREHQTGGIIKNINIEEDQFVSRIHAKIVFDGRRFKLSDSSSRSGTYLNGNKINGWVTLEDGDLIQVGKTVLKFTQNK
jgi:hypothetical protein